MRAFCYHYFYLLCQTEMILADVLEQVRVGDIFFRESLPEILYERILIIARLQTLWYIHP